MKITRLTLAILMAVPASSVFAAALDRSGQSISAFLQPNNYFEAGLSVLDPTVTGQEAGTSPTQRHISDMGDQYSFGQAAFKFQPTNYFSFGLLYDQPFGADAAYTGNNVFVNQAGDTILGATQLAGIRQAQITENVSKNLPDALKANLENSVNQQVAARAAAAIKSGAVPAGTPQALVEASIRNNADQIGAIRAGVTAAITQQVTNTVTQRVDAGLAAVNKTVGGSGGGTSVSVNTHSVSLILGYQPNVNWNLYAGPVYQSVEGRVKLRGQAFSIYNGYDATIPQKDEWGWLAGISYQIPDIALKAALTYRSDISYDMDVREDIPTLGALALLGKSDVANLIAASNDKTRIKTPKSVNLDLQSGIMANTVAFANVRWVPWSDFSIQPAKFGMLSKAIGPLVNKPDGFKLVQYSEDQWSANVGVGRKFSEKWAGNVSLGWDSGAGDPVTTLGPTNGYWNAGLGVQYSPAANYFIAGGLKYLRLGDAKAQTGAQFDTDNYVARFKNNDAMAYGLKIGYRF